MSLGESLLRALESLSAHKLRSVLTMLGMISGVSAVIAMLSIGAGAERQALEMIRRMGISNLLVRAKEYRTDELQEVRKKSIGVSLRDATGIEEAVPGVAFTGPRVRVNPWSARARGGKSEAKVSGVSFRHADLVSLPLAAGRFLSKGDEEHHAQVCVLGDGARRQDVLVQFVVEAFALSALGGILRGVLGVLIAKVVAATAGWPTVVTAWSLLLSTGVSGAVGLLSGFSPALRAASIDPIEALRYE